MGTLVVLSALAVGACTPDYVTDSEADVSLFVNSINNGAVLLSDVRTGNLSEQVFADNVSVALANRSKNPNVTEVQVARAIDVDRYTVRYLRSDGRNTEGVDVPYSITGDLRTVVDVGNNINVSLQVVRAQAKLDPPLTNLRRGSPSVLAGPPGAISPSLNVVLSVIAEITVYGRTTSGDTVSDSGRLQIDFSDYAEGSNTGGGTP
jgi:hypothetical protein